MITNGRFIRGFNTTHATLSINFDKLFRSFSNIFCLGLSIEQDDNGNNYILIDKYETFFNRELVHTIDNGSKMEIIPDTDQMINSVEAGYQKIQTKKKNQFNT